MNCQQDTNKNDHWMGIYWLSVRPLAEQEVSYYCEIIHEEKIVKIIYHSAEVKSEIRHMQFRRRLAKLNKVLILAISKLFPPHYCINPL
jgi:hypothetical protein